MTSEVEERPRLVTGGYGPHRRQWVNKENKRIRDYLSLKDFKDLTGLEIATDTVANATKTFNLATKNSSVVATLATMVPL